MNRVPHPDVSLRAAQDPILGPDRQVVDIVFHDRPDRRIETLSLGAGILFGVLFLAGAVVFLSDMEGPADPLAAAVAGGSFAVLTSLAAAIGCHAVLIGLARAWRARTGRAAGVATDGATLGPRLQTIATAVAAMAELRPDGRVHVVFDGKDRRGGQTARLRIAISGSNPPEGRAALGESARDIALSALARADRPGRPLRNGRPGSLLDPALLWMGQPGLAGLHCATAPIGRPTAHAALEARRLIEG